MQVFFRFLARWPLPLLHAVGAALGWLIYALSPTYRRRFVTNSGLAGLTPTQARSAIAHAGRMVAELPRLWLGKPAPTDWTGLSAFDAAHENGKGIIFLTPHLGCFEITAQAIAAAYAPQGRQLNVLYRPARFAWLQSVMSASRNRVGMRAIPATMSGVKALVKALRHGEALGILPDQVPPLGLGQWATFFGQAAYTMTLPAKLVQQTGAQLVLVWGERLPAGRGYTVHFSEFDEPLANDLQQACQQINAAMERMIARCPQQYLWGYARYKAPREGILSAASNSRP